MLNREVKEILKGAKELISDKEKFCTDSYARDINYNGVSFNDSTATKWCSIGAIDKITVQNNNSTTNRVMAYRYLNMAAIKLGHIDAPNLNDTDYNLVVPMFDLAIKMCEEENV